MKLRWGYFISGCIIGLITLFQWVRAFPDGRLHITACNVGQGDAFYIRFPDGRDMVVDGGPGEKVLECLGKAMPIIDRSIDLVLLTHPESDHMAGLTAILSRYRVGTVLRSDVSKDTDGFRAFLAGMKRSGATEKLLASGDSVDVGAVRLLTLWPSSEEVAILKRAQEKESGAVAGMFTGMDQSAGGVVGDESGSSTVSQSTVSVNDGSVVFLLSYGSFDMLFFGDADDRVQPMITLPKPADGVVDVVKVPHHGAKAAFDRQWFTGLTSMIHTDNCRLCEGKSTEKQGEAGKPCCSTAILSVGKNSYGHPSQITLTRLQEAGFGALRTDQKGRITITTDGTTWDVKTEK